MRQSQQTEPTAENLRNIPEPTFVYKVGERVTYGAWKYAKILEICKDGLYYKCFIKTPNISYGIRKGDKEETVYLYWTDLKPYRTPEEIDQIEKIQEDEDIFFNYSQRHLESLLNMLYKSTGLDLEPDYQRGNVWDLHQKTSLIESIFKNIDIGKFTIIKRTFREKQDYYYEMLDGKQRTIAISEFFLGLFTYKGMRYQDLHPYDQQHFRSYPISYAETKNLTNEQKYRYFLKLNTTGEPHDMDHIERVYPMWTKEKKDGS